MGSWEGKIYTALPPNFMGLERLFLIWPLGTLLYLGLGPDMWAMVHGAHDIYIIFERWCRKMEQSNLGTVYLAICAWKHDCPGFLFWSYWLVKVLVGFGRDWGYLPCKNDNFAFKEKDTIYERADKYWTIRIFHFIKWFNSTSFTKQMHCLLRKSAVWRNWHWGVAESSQN